MKEYKLLISQYRSNSLLLTLCKIPWNLTSGPCRIRGPMHGHPYNSISVPLVIPPPPISLDQKKTFYQLLGHFKALAKGGKCTERSFGSYHNQVRGGGDSPKNVLKSRSTLLESLYLSIREKEELLSGGGRGGGSSNFLK